MSTKRKLMKMAGLLVVAALLFAALPAGQAQAQTTLCVNVGGTDGCYASIQLAIDAANAGDTIKVGPGTYYGAITINEEVTLQSTDGPETTIIHGGTTSNDTLYPVSIRVSNVILDGFTVTSPNYNVPAFPDGDPIGITIGHYGDNSLENIVVRNNHVTQIGSSDRVVPATGYPSVGIVVNGVVAGLQITNNKIYDIHQTVIDSTVTWGPTGIALYGYGPTPLSSGVVISGNEVYNISVNADAPETTISNGIRAGWGSGDVTISDNSVHDIDGRAIAVTSSNNGVATITENDISNADTGIYLFNLEGGVLSGNTFTNVTVEVEQPPVHNVTQNKWYSTIQAAIDAASDSDTITVAAGTYVENLYIDEDVKILGAGAGSTIIQSPDILPVCFDDLKAIVCIDDAVAELDGLTVDGLGKGKFNFRFVGVVFHNAGGVLQNSEVLNIEETPFSGTQHGLGIYGYFDNGERHLLSIKNNTVQGFQKNGITFNSYENTPVIVDIVGNTVVGEGATSTIGQNGIQTQGYSVIVNIEDNIVRDIAYDNTNYVAATSIVNYLANATIEGNSISGGHVGVYNFDAPAKINNNVFSIEKVGSFAYGIIATDPPDVVPAGVDVYEDRAGAPANRQAALKVEIKDNEVTFVGDENTDTFGIEADSGYGPENLSVLMSGNIIDGFDYGISIYKGTSDVGIFTDVTAVDNCIYNSYSYGLWSNDDSITVNALNNFWGHATGPYHPTLNPLGIGDAVSESGIDFDPWSSTCSKPVPRYEQKIFLPLFISN